MKRTPAITTGKRINKYNDTYFSFEGWYFHIEDDILEAWCKRFDEELVASTLVNLREWLKTRPKFEETIEDKYGGNWVYWIWDCLERAEDWGKINENKNEFTKEVDRRI